MIHGVDSILVPPPKAAEAIQYFPGEFSTLELGLTKTGLLEHINDTSNHVGGTLFAPDNFAFVKLGPKINAFLFSSYGLKYLKALLKYHIVADHTLYSDAYYKAQSKDADTTGIPKGYFHVGPNSICVMTLLNSIGGSSYGPEGQIIEHRCRTLRQIHQHQD